MAGLGYAVYLVSASGQGARLIGSKLVVVRSTYGEHNSTKSPFVLPDDYHTGVLYRGILQNTLVPFARHYFGDNYRYQDDSATPHRARVVLDFLQQGNVTKMEQPPRSPDCNPIQHLWDDWAEQSALWTIRLRILMNFARPCWINGRRSLYNAFSAL